MASVRARGGRGVRTRHREPRIGSVIDQRAQRTVPLPVAEGEKAARGKRTDDFFCFSWKSKRRVDIRDAM